MPRVEVESQQQALASSKDEGVRDMHRVEAAEAGSALEKEGETQASKKSFIHKSFTTVSC